MAYQYARKVNSLSASVISTSIVESRSIPTTTECPLLSRLPRELRDQIWRDLFPPQIIHITSSENAPQRQGAGAQPRTTSTTWWHRVCLYGTSEEAVAATYRRRHTLVNIDRHSECWPMELHLAYAPRNPRVDLGVLGTCRQVYEEAAPVFWSRASFSFMRHQSFDAFVRGRSEGNLRWMGGLHVRMDLRSEEDMEWLAALSYLSKLPLDNLGCLYIAIRQWCSVERNEKYGFFYAEEALSKLCELPLKRANVLLGCLPLHTPNPAAGVEEQVEWTRGMERRLLHPVPCAVWLDCQD